MLILAVNGLAVIGAFMPQIESKSALYTQHSVKKCPARSVTTCLLPPLSVLLEVPDPGGRGGGARGAGGVGAALPRGAREPGGQAQPRGPRGRVRSV